MAPPRVDVLGKRFGRLTVVSEIPREERRRAKDPEYLCACDCGGSARAKGYSLAAGNMRSCGCSWQERSPQGENSWNWKGDDAQYGAIHKWIREHKIKTGTCSDCGEHVGAHGLQGTQWSNVDHEYRRDLNDYVERCPKCHARYDIACNTKRVA